MEENKPLTDEDFELVRRDQDGRKLRRYYERKMIDLFKHKPIKDRPVILVDLLMDAFESSKLSLEDKNKLTYLVSIIKEIFHEDLNK